MRGGLCSTTIATGRRGNEEGNMWVMSRQRSQEERERGLIYRTVNLALLIYVREVFMEGAR